MANVMLNGDLPVFSRKGKGEVGSFARPHPIPVASQARHQSVSRGRTFGCVPNAVTSQSPEQGCSLRETWSRIVVSSGCSFHTSFACLARREILRAASNTRLPQPLFRNLFEVGGGIPARLRGAWSIADHGQAKRHAGGKPTCVVGIDNVRILNFNRCE